MNDELNAPASDQFAADLQSLMPDADLRIVVEDPPVMLWLTNTDGKVAFTNSKWMKFVGRSA